MTKNLRGIDLFEDNKVTLSISLAGELITQANACHKTSVKCERSTEI